MDLNKTILHFVTFCQCRQQSPQRRSLPVSEQAQVHNSFNRFTEIGQIFHNIYIFNEKIK